MRKVFFIAALGLLISCAPEEKAIDYVLFSGNVTNSNAETVKMRGNDFSAELAIDCT